MNQKIKESREYLENKGIESPDILVILGTGLSGLSELAQDQISVDYESIPNFPHSTVLSHAGKLIFGNLSGKRVLMMAGRFHYYEGYDMDQVIFPLRVMFSMGCKLLIVSNAAGGVNPDFNPGDIMCITDHINLTGANPLRGPNDETLGTRFPLMLDCYGPELIETARSVAEEKNIVLKRGVYLGLQGPSLETRAEYRMARLIGADAVGMSTVPEVIAARHMNVKVSGFSVITNVTSENREDNSTHDDVIDAAGKAANNLQNLIEEMIGRIRF